MIVFIYISKGEAQDRAWHQFGVTQFPSQLLPFSYAARGTGPERFGPIKEQQITCAPRLLLLLLLLFSFSFLVLHSTLTSATDASSCHHSPRAPASSVVVHHRREKIINKSGPEREGGDDVCSGRSRRRWNPRWPILSLFLRKMYHQMNFFVLRRILVGSL